MVKAFIYFWYNIYDTVGDCAKTIRLSPWHFTATVDDTLLWPTHICSLFGARASKLTWLYLRKMTPLRLVFSPRSVNCDRSSKIGVKWTPLLTPFDNSLSASLQWLNNGHDGVSNHQPHYCLLNRLLGRRSKKHTQSSASLAFAWGIHRGPVNSPHKRPVTRKMFPFDDVIIFWRFINAWCVDKSMFIVGELRSTLCTTRSVPRCFLDVR